MPRSRPATTGYERLAQADRFSDDEDGDVDDHPLGAAAAAAARPAAPSAPSGGSSSLPPAWSQPTIMGAASSTAAAHRRRPSYYDATSIQNYNHYNHNHNNSNNNDRRRNRANSGVDLKAINARLERWADEIAAKFKRHRRRGDDDDDDDEERLEIHYSVFQAPEGVRPVTAESLAAAAEEDERGRADEGEQRDGQQQQQPQKPPTVMRKREFEAIVDSVRTAIRQGVHPRMISQGSSGSYFACNPDGKVVGVFKPKDEEPYAAGNPKWNKWIHRNLFPCCFGRACLIPNLSYVSEAAAYVLDAQLRTHMVPYTDVVYLASRAFHYPFWDRYSHSRNRKPLPPKPGSFQVFLKGFQDANVFLREHPWPDQYLSGFRTSDGRRRRRRRRRWADNCRPGGPKSSSSTNGSSSRASTNTATTPGSHGGSPTGGGGGGDYDYLDEDDYSDSDDEVSGSARNSPGRATPGPGNFVWTEPLKQTFREELEKLVILDYIMRNTDRGLDNWMIKVDWTSQAVSIASEPMHLHMGAASGSSPGAGGSGSGSRSGSGSEGEQGPRPVDLSQRPAASRTRASYPSYRAPQPMNASTPPPPNDTDTDNVNGARSPDRNAVPQPSITIGAIDNSLSWPWKHPDAWRSFPFGWLFLPVDLIGRPFSQKTRDHFLPLLTSTAWWAQTQRALRRVFQLDPDFQERMFARQLAVMKGQAWNVVETLKTPDHGPLELTRRAKVCVWDDLVEVPIAVPMRATSSEARRRAASELAKAMQEEMDLGAAAPSSSNSHRNAGDESNDVGGDEGEVAENDGDDDDDDLLISSNTSPLPHPGRFELTKESVVVEEEEEGAVGAGGAAGDLGSGTGASSSHRPKPHRSSSSNNNNNKNLDTRSSGAQTQPANHQRRYSYTTAAARRQSNSLAQQLYGERFGAGAATAAATTRPPYHARAASMDNPFLFDDRNRRHHPQQYTYPDDEGDLGFAAAAGMENNRRKVIVERLEPVKSKNPVFTWC
ncbi:phosphatidylinositol 4-kinase type 2 subunit [Niveomyces insectorum RCEF 264]|uniref:1-phosphatidylinositol 4-kinase n=1 Tax=Niveomyces insectorum RCEF 264 TaxID=1081102 RepID=A0A167SEP4_9HYPO|nr:phosphatidylinositol 4-kinase type 2 subunit [Niveomyces insectorum RCEF 264]